MAHRGRKNAEEALLNALACGATVDVAADKAAISRRTAYRWLQEPVFKRRLTDLKADTVRRAADMLTAANLEAVKTLLDLLKPTAPYYARLGAARSIIELGTRLRENNDFAQRLAALENQLQGQPTKRSQQNAQETIS